MFSTLSSARRGLRSVLVVATAGLAALVPVTGVGSARSAHDAAPQAVALPPMAEVSGPVHDVPVGGALPSDATCAARVQPVAESRPQNNTYNRTRGSSPNNQNPRVTGNFVGTTDEIIQWAACKWGLDPAWARAQALVESFWIQTTASDFGSDGCLPGHPIGADGRPGQCPQSIGLLQVRYPYHQSAFEDNNAIRSTAYNADYAWSIWRDCFDGRLTWLNTVERGRQYAAGDGLGCMGVWFSGRWYTSAAVGYMSRVSGTDVPSSPTTPSRPSAPRWLTAVGGVGSGQIRLSWTAPASTGGAAITDYVIQRSWDRRNWTSISDGVNTNRTFVVSGNKNGARYYFRVAARNSAGWSPVSNIATAIPYVAAPSAPRSLTAVGGVGSGQVRLSWTAPASTGGAAITDYVIQRSWDRRNWTSISDGVNTNRTFVVSGNKNGARYYFRVAARNSVGWGPVSNIASAIPSAPTTFAATAAASAVPEPTTTTTSTTLPPQTTPSPSAAASPAIAAVGTTTPVSTTTTSDAAPPSGSIGDFVWLDADGDGRQAAPEVGVADVAVRLLDGDDVPIATTVTDEHGAYEFTALAAGTYRVEIDVRDGYATTTPDAGSDDEVDSDAIHVDEPAGTARTERFDVADELAVTRVDIGLVLLPSEPTDTTTTPETTAPPTAADTTAPPTTLPATTVEPTTTTPVSTSTTMVATTTSSSTTTTTTTTILAPT